MERPGAEHQGEGGDGSNGGDRIVELEEIEEEIEDAAMGSAGLVEGVGSGSMDLDATIMGTLAGLVTAAELTDASHPYGRAYAQFQLVDNITRIVGGRRSLPVRGLLEALHMDPSAELPGASELAGIVQGLPVAQRLAAYNVFRHRQLTLVPKKLLAEEVADSEQPKTKRVRFNF